MSINWNSREVRELENNPLLLRVFSSRLLGRNPELVLHGGGNTSVKLTEINLFGEEEEVLHVKGSGLDLAVIDAQGFTPLRMKQLLKLVAIAEIGDTEMARQLRLAMTEPDAPSPSVEALLHAVIPYAWVDHTHADAVVTLTNSKQGENLIRELYGNRLFIVPYIMPGFKLAREVYEMTGEIDWDRYEGMVLLNHGLVTFGKDAHTSYKRMLDLVSVAEEYLELTTGPVVRRTPGREDLLSQARLRRLVSFARGSAMLARADRSAEANGFSGLPNAKQTVARGPITSDHLIRTKPFPVFLENDFARSIDNYVAAYKRYFERHAHEKLTPLDPAPRWAVWPGQGTLAFGRSWEDLEIVTDIVGHTLLAIQRGEALGGWQPVSEEHQFEAEYWELQQAKLSVERKLPEFQGKIALVSGAASGIGLACTQELHRQGAAVTGLDLNPQVPDILNEPGVLGITCDVTDRMAVTNAVESVVRNFGGLDVLVLNAGTFPAGLTIADMKDKTWGESLEINLTAPMHLLQTCVPFLKEGIDPAVVFMVSRNVPAPGPGAAAYSVPKAGQTQLARIAALELGKFGIRVNILHPDCVYDTGLWTPEALERSAKRYGLTVEEYKSRNVLKQDVKTNEVARMVCAMAGSVFAKTTGAQVPIDGGNERVI